MYVVVEQFADLRDEMHIYNAGDTFPRAGAYASNERIRELAGSDNRVGRPLIRAVELPFEAPEPEDVEDIKPEQKRAKKGVSGRLRGRGK